jgi:hypothetical protein
MPGPANDQPTVRDRMLTAGLTLDRIEEHLRAGRVRVDGQLVTDPYHPAPQSAVVVLALD